MDAVIVFLGSYLIFVIAALAAFVGIKAKNKLEFTAALLLAGFLAFDLSALLGSIFYNPRPFVVQGIEPLIAHGPENGFPSQHTVMAAALATLIYFYNRKLAAAAALMALLVGAGRVWGDVHSWIDILGGAAVGITAGYAGIKIVRFLLARLSAKQQASRR